MTEMIGCLADMPSSPGASICRTSPVAQQATPAEERRARPEMRLAVEALDIGDLGTRAQHDRHAPVQGVRHEIEDAPLARRGAAARLLDEEGDRIGPRRAASGGRARTPACDRRDRGRRRRARGCGRDPATGEAVQRMLKSSPRGHRPAQDALVHVRAHHGIPVAVVGGVDRVLAPVRRDEDARAGSARTGASRARACTGSVPEPRVNASVVCGP